MPVVSLQHINTRSLDVERTRAFYEEVLGLQMGPRPPFASSGYWLYLGDDPVVHLVQRPAGEPANGDVTGNLDHIAFGATDIEQTRAALRARGIPFREALVPRDNIIQLFVKDPDGVQLELNFPND